MKFENRTLGRTNLPVSPLGLSTGRGGLPAAEVERAFERGFRYFYWGTLRSGPFAQGLRNVVRGHRSEIVTVIQTYTRAAGLMKGSLTRALSKLGLEYTDLLLLGWWNEPPPPRIKEAALELKARGMVKHVMVSCHDRTTFARYAADPDYGAIMVRYNAVHPGAESDVFPHLGSARPGVVSYTATRWGDLLDPAVLPKGEPAPRASDCYRFVLTNSSVDMALCAPRNGADLDEALEAIERGPMSADELAWMKRVGAHVKKETAGRRTFSPMDVIDRVRGWFSGTKPVGFDTRTD